MSMALQNNGRSNFPFLLVFLSPRSFFPLLLPPIPNDQSISDLEVIIHQYCIAIPKGRKRKEEIFTVQNGSDYITDQQSSPSSSHPRSPGDTSSILTSTAASPFKSTDAEEIIMIHIGSSRMN
eukprot:GHVN01003326.1.p1 GENE.GHVN01003326.1~~GHVN01003326.1.p1  ORF type:complete len:123 (+),score=9.71 GHVN01003326.1:497-865(+)